MLPFFMEKNKKKTAFDLTRHLTICYNIDVTGGKSSFLRLKTLDYGVLGEKQKTT